MLYTYIVLLKTIELYDVVKTLHRNYWHNYEKRCCVISHKQLKTLLRDNMVKLKIISLYIYTDLRLRHRILGLMSHVTIITWMGWLPSAQSSVWFPF